MRCVDGGLWPLRPACGGGDGGFSVVMEAGEALDRDGRRLMRVAQVRWDGGHAGGGGGGRGATRARSPHLHKQGLFGAKFKFFGLNTC